MPEVSRPIPQPAAPVPGRLARMYAVNDDSFRPSPKTAPARNRALLDMARGQPCLLRIPGVCNSDPATTVACHSNQAKHGKAGARKADDQWSVHGCSDCHRWLDSGMATASQKIAAFNEAHRRMVIVWTDMVEDRRPANQREYDAAKWALGRLR